MNHQDFGYATQEDFDRVLKHAQSVSFLVARTIYDLENAKATLMDVIDELTGLPDHEEESPFSTTLRLWIKKHIGRVEIEAKKLGFLQAFKAS